MLWTSCDDLLSVFQTLVNLGLPGDAHCGGRVPVLWTSCDDLLSVFQTLVNLGYLEMPIVGAGFPCCGRPVTTYYLCFRLLLTWATW